ncbi:unnamed protein product [Wuchereria bancrofti]|uniref:Uncharacterized protein n=1 Tax=Wuchereria bancrofti TaxID=6293 RepID=A0A3P7FW23_WUCBA|nr:unnamed protein product [Wuchereria bancrofti]
MVTVAVTSSRKQLLQQVVTVTGGRKRLLRQVVVSGYSMKQLKVVTVSSSYSSKWLQMIGSGCKWFNSKLVQLVKLAKNMHEFKTITGSIQQYN